MLIRAHGLNKYYGRLHVLKDMALALPAGSLGLLGPNGAGKSTFLKIMLGLLPSSSGSVEVLGFEASERSLDLRQKVGYMPEGECHVSGLDAVELCTYAGQLCGLPRSAARERAHAVLAFVGLEDKRYQQVETYSTGQKQRVKLAQALVHDPELLFLDEPTNGLDPRGREEMLALINDLPPKRGCSILLSSHLLPDVESVCDSAILLHEGRVLFSGPIADMHDGSSTDASELYDVRVKADLKGLASALEDAGCTVEWDGGSITVGLPSGAEPELIFRKAAEIKVQVRHLAPVRQTLESAFLRILRQGGR